MTTHYTATWRRGGPSGEPGCAIDVFVDSDKLVFWPMAIIGAGGGEVFARYASQGLLASGQVVLKLGMSRLEIEQALQDSLQEVTGGPVHIDSFGPFNVSNAA